MRPFRPGDPHFWEDDGYVEDENLWQGGSAGDKFVSDDLWKIINHDFPGAFYARQITERNLPGKEDGPAIQL